jgi:hypothetical protein
MWGLLVLGVSSVLVAGCTAPRAQADVRERMMTDATVQVSTIPPLDAAAPAALETATFALG